MRFLPVNLHSFLIELSSLDETLALYEALRENTPPGVEEMIPAARSVLIRISQPQYRGQLVREILQRRFTHSGQPLASQVVIPVCYNGEDLPVVAEIYGVSVRDIISRHQQSVWKVAFMGFAPGFAYLVSADGGWQTPRRQTPRTRIPSGSLALAGEFSGVYPQASPGGWQLIGQTRCPMWDSARQPPALLQPGVEVRFVDEKQAQTLISVPSATQADTPDGQQATAPPHAEHTGADLLAVLTSGLQTSWQDNGRMGYASMGISGSGALDKIAWRDANRLVGNPHGTPCLEITQGGFRGRAQRDLVLAVTGAPCPLTLIIRGKSYNVTFAAPFAVAAGDEIVIGTPRCGVRSYLAVRGGCATHTFLGSAAWDSLAQVGPVPLRAGDMLRAPQPPLNLLVVLPDAIPVATLPASGDTVTLDILAGPRTDWFSASALEILTDQRWQVTAQSNRIGLRLDGATPLARSQYQELPSEGTCCGAIQVPASGQPVLFLRDHPLTGGYPVIASVAEHHVDLAGQIPPGAWLRFNLIYPFQELSDTSGEHDSL